MKSFNFFGSYSSNSCPIEAITYLDNSGITNPDIRSNVCLLVSELKDEGVWSLIGVLYPDVGANATQNKLNLINPLDTDAAFRRTFHGGVTFDPMTGTKGDGVNGYYNTKYSLSSNGVTASTGFGMLIFAGAGSNRASDIGCYSGSSSDGSVHIDVNFQGNTRFRGLNKDTYSLTTPATLSQEGFYSVFREPNSLVYQGMALGNGFTSVNKPFAISNLEIYGLTINANGNISNPSTRSQKGVIIFKNATQSDVGKMETALANFNSRR